MGDTKHFIINREKKNCDDIELNEEPVKNEENNKILGPIIS